MRRILIGLSAAAVVGSTLLLVPGALASPTPKAPAVVTTAAVVGPATSQNNDDGKDKDKKHDEDEDKKDKDCDYPVNHPSLTLSVQKEDGRAVFTSRLTKNKCKLSGRHESLLDHNNKVVATAVTNGSGVAQFSIKAVKNESYHAVYAAGNATSNTVVWHG